MKRTTREGPSSSKLSRGYIFPRNSENYTNNNIQKYLQKKFSNYSRIPNVTVGDYTYGTPEIYWYDEVVSLKIGKFCSIAKGVSIFLGGEHHVDFLTSYPFVVYPFEWSSVERISELGIHPSKGDVIIGNDVWIGANVTILSGVTIGDGAVVGANTLVCKDVEPYTICGGNPVKPIRKRFDDTTIQILKELSWWNWDKEKINQAIPFLLSSDILGLKEFHEGYE